MNNNFYYAITIEENGKYYSYVVKISTNDNILSRLKIPGIISATICNSKKQAAQLVTLWNTCHKINGTYLFDEIGF